MVNQHETPAILVEEPRREPEPTFTPTTSQGGDFARAIRVATGLIVGTVLVILFFDTRSYVQEMIDTLDASAIQITQIYAERLFYAVCAIGVGIMAYILTRYTD